MKKKSVLSVLALSCVLCLCSCSNGSTEIKTEAPAYTSIDISDTSVADNEVWEYRVSSGDYTSDTIGTKKEIPVISTNPALKDKELEVYIMVQGKIADSVYIAFSITEKNKIESVYDYHSDTCYFEVKMTDTNGILSELEGRVSSNSNIVLIKKTDHVRKVIDALHQNGKLSFEIIDTDHPASTYSFSVDTSNFDEVYRKSGFSVQSNLLYG